MFKIVLIFLMIPFKSAFALSCRTMSMRGCEVKACVGKVSQYPGPVAFLIPKKPKSLRIHLHGFSESINPVAPFNPSYDWNNVRYPTIRLAAEAFESGAKDSPEFMIRAYGMTESVCKNQELVVVPISRGRCDTYKKFFVSPESLGVFISSAYESLNRRRTLPIHLSGHSGAGKYLKILLSREIPELLEIYKVSAYDAFYSQGEAESLLKWFLRADGRILKSVVLSQGPPQRFAEAAFKGRYYPLLSHTRVRKSLNMDHWALVRAYWP